MKKKRLLTILGVTGLILTLVALPLAACAPTPAEEEVQEIAYLSGTWGDLVAVPAASAEILNTYLPGVRVSVVKSAGSEMNSMMASTMAPNTIMYHTCSMDFVAAYLGTPPWEEAYPNQALLASLVPGYLIFLTWDEKIKTVYDLKGKTVQILPLPSLQLRFFEDVLKLAGMSKDDLDIVFLDFGALEDALRDKTVDTVFPSVWGVPGRTNLSSAMQETLYALKDKMYAVEIPEDIVKTAATNLRSGFAVWKVTPHDFLPLWPEGKELWCHAAYFAQITVRGDMDEELAYNITKTLYEHTDVYADFYPNGKFVTPETMVGQLEYAREDMLHSGAIKYFKEAGLWDIYVEARAKFVAAVGEY